MYLSPTPTPLRLNKGKSLSKEDATGAMSQEFGEKVFISEMEESEKEEQQAREQAMERRKRMLAKVCRSGPKRGKYCDICMKSGDHWSSSCPLQEDIPNPENTTVGEKYEIRCCCCRKSDHGHPDGTWAGYLCKKRVYQKQQPVKQDADSHHSSYLPLICEVCDKVVNHFSFQCPYLKDVPNPDNTTLGKGFEIRCRHCNKSDHGHPDGSWQGYAWYKGWDSDVDQGRAWYKGWGSGPDFMKCD